MAPGDAGSAPAMSHLGTDPFGQADAKMDKRNRTSSESRQLESRGLTGL
jgi:hypothetical protein